MPGTTLSAIHGVVVSRHGDVLEVRGAVDDHGDHGDFESHTLHVTLSTNTKVLNEFDNSAATPAAVSIGSLVSAYGTLDKSGASPNLDVTQGRVVLHLNEIAGAVVSTNPLTVDLATMNGMRPVSFNFAGTGSTTESNANPHTYVVDTTGIDLGTLENGDALRVRGMVAAFAAAHPDFKASTLIDVKHATHGAEVTISWQPATATPFSAASASGLTLNLTGARSELRLGDVHQTNGDAAVTKLIPANDGNGTFAIGTKGTEEVRVFKTFAEFVTALNAGVDSTHLAARLSASGQFNAVDGTLTVQRLGVQVAAPAPAN